MKDKIQQIRQKLNAQKNKIGLVGGRIILEEYDETDHNISASINPKNWEIKVSVRKGFNPIQDKEQERYARARGIEEGLETLLLHVGGLHEPAHWELPVDSERGCPYAPYDHDRILEAVKQALPTDKQSHTGYIANAFEDLMINPRCFEFNKDFSGQVLFWDWEGLTAKEKGLKNYTPVYEAFVKLNMYLFGDETDKALLERHYSNDKKVDSVVQKTIQDLGLKKIGEDQNTAYLFNRQRWSQMAGLFARNLANLLDEQPQERLSAFDPDSNEKEQSGNGVEQQAKTKQGKEGIVFGRYSSGDPVSTNAPSHEQLELLYKRLARDISVKVEAITRRNSLEIAPLNYRAYDEETDDPTKIKPCKLFLTRDGLTFGVPNQPLTVAQKTKIQRRSFPDFKRVILDCSGTMQNGIDGSGPGKTTFIPWGDNSKYHYALLGDEGIMNFLTRQGIAQYINHGLALFSSSTKYREAGFFDLSEIRKLKYSPDWGTTNLDAGVLRQALQGKESFVLSLSDGAIHNWDTEREEIRKLIENNYFAHIQIGSGETQYTRDLESWGHPVFYVTSGDDLSKLMVNITKGTYEKFTKQ